MVGSFALIGAVWIAQLGNPIDGVQQAGIVSQQYGAKLYV